MQSMNFSNMVDSLAPLYHAPKSSNRKYLASAHSNSQSAYGHGCELVLAATIISFPYLRSSLETVQSIAIPFQSIDALPSQHTSAFRTFCYSNRPKNLNNFREIVGHSVIAASAMGSEVFAEHP